MLIEVHKAAALSICILSIEALEKIPFFKTVGITTPSVLFKSMTLFPIAIELINQLIGAYLCKTKF